MLKSRRFPETRLSLLDSLRADARRSGWMEFYGLYAPAIFRVARARGLPVHDAEDIVQQTMLEVSRHIDRFELAADRGRFRNWMQVIAERRIVDHRRRLQSNDEKIEGLAKHIDRPDADESMWSREWELADIQYCLEQVAENISPKRMRAFQMYCLEGRSADEVAAELGMSRGHVYVTRSQVLNMIREKIDELDAAPPGFRRRQADR